MKIGIDARFIGPQGTGLGKYTQKLIVNLAEIDRKNHYVIFLKKSNWDFLSLPKNFTKALAEVHWYSLAEQLKMPKIISRQNIDLLHVPHFNVPIFYKGKFIVTIHDLIHHKFEETSVTTKNPIVFKFKRFAYRKVIENAIRKSQKIITPSNFVKDEIVKAFKVNSGKIEVTYEAAEEEYFTKKNYKLTTTDNKLIYVGNAYPHKNLNKLLDAMTLNREPKTQNIKLIIVCPRNIFSERLELEIKKRNLEKKVELRGYLEPKELSNLFQKSSTYIFPTLSEGFGIPGLNAMASGLPVVCSDILVLREIYSNAAIYFDPNDPQDIVQKINKALEPTTRSDLVEKGRQQVKKYSWLKMAQLTLKIYESA